MSEEPAGGSVLVVDDEPTAHRVLKLGLEAARYQVATASDGMDALEKLGERRFDVVITDLVMPRMDGRELCEKLLGDRRDRMPLIFLLTGRADAEWSGDVGKVEVVEKPVSLRKLLARIREGLADGQRADEVPR